MHTHGAQPIEATVQTLSEAIHAAPVVAQVVCATACMKRFLHVATKVLLHHFSSMGVMGRNGILNGLSLGA
jgi:hypothetical protein